MPTKKPTKTVPEATHRNYEETGNKSPRPPVVVIMGHIDHGKSTLLDYIRKSKIVEGEVGGITQKMSAYEVSHKTKDQSGNEVDKKITFLDTPGHESFGAIRTRGAIAADIAILIVSAEDGVKPQTIDAYKSIKKANLPYIVGISKIDKENANLERTKISLAENEIYLEGYGGDIPFVPFSGKTGAGIPELMDMILLVADLENFTADTTVPAEAVIIESHRDKNRGISATLIIKNGTLKTGMVIVAGDSYSPVRIMENHLGKSIREGLPGSPVRVIGWNNLPTVGGYCLTFENKKLAEKFMDESREKEAEINQSNRSNKSTQNRTSSINSTNPINSANSANSTGGTSLNKIEPTNISIIIKADTSGSLEALRYEIGKINIERVNLRIIGEGLGDIQESDIKMAGGITGTLIIGFSVKIDSAIKMLAEKVGIEVQIFDIIYKMSEWLETVARDRTPKMEIEEQKGMLKVLKFFSATKDRQVLGCRCESGLVNTDDQVRVLRRGVEIARGRVRELQKQRERVGEINEGEFGCMIDSKMEITPGDYLEAIHTVVK